MKSEYWRFPVFINIEYGKKFWKIFRYHQVGDILRHVFPLWGMTNLFKAYEIRSSVYNNVWRFAKKLVLKNSESTFYGVIYIFWNMLSCFKVDAIQQFQTARSEIFLR